MYHANVNVNCMVENVIQMKSRIMINVHASIKCHICEKCYYWNATCSSENGKYLASIIDNSVLTCDEIIDAEKQSQLQQILMKKNTIYKIKNLYILLALIAVSSYCYLIKHKSKQKHLLPYYVTSDKSINGKLIDAL